MSFLPKSACIVLVLAVQATGWAQQLPQVAPAPSAMAKAAIERRLQSKHPKVPIDPNLPTPGKYLLDRAALRSKQLQSRIQTTKKIPNSRPAGSAPSGALPGIQFRPSLPAGNMADAVVSRDFNGDGHVDFVIANGGY